MEVPCFLRVWFYFGFLAITVAISCTSKDEPIMINGFMKKSFTMKPSSKVKDCNGYCVGKEVFLDATLANGEQVHIRNIHYSCLPVVPKAIIMCNVACESKVYKDDRNTSKSVDRSVGSLKRVLEKEIGDFSFEKAVEKTCCCKTQRCSRMMDGRLRLALRSSYKIN